VKDCCSSDAQDALMAKASSLNAGDTDPLLGIFTWFTIIDQAGDAGKSMFWLLTAIQVARPDELSTRSGIDDDYLRWEPNHNHESAAVPTVGRIIIQRRIATPITTVC
jgi:hypothetical protein